MTREFIELPEFLKGWQEAGLNDDDLNKLEIYLCNYPDKGVLIQGTGGLRKLRWKIRDKGKRGGIRILYVDFICFEKIYLIAAYKKSEKEDIKSSEKKEIKKLIESLRHELERKILK